MHAPESEFDPDDNYADGLDPDLDTDEDTSAEALVWQLLLLINPGDEETALQQFGAYQDATADTVDESFGPAWVLKDIIDWKSGFQLHGDDAAAFVESITELVSRWNLRLDWGVEDPTDDELLDDADLPALMQLAYDSLRADGYTLWLWDTGTEIMVGWIALSRDDEAMHAVAQALGIELRPAALL